MNWEAIGAIGEILGAAGVIATLVYLTAQIRQNTNSLRVAARQNQNQELGSFVDRTLDEEELRRVWKNVYAEHFAPPEFGSVPSEDRVTAAVIAYRAFLNLSNPFYSWESGSLSDDEWTQSSALIDAYLSIEFVGDWWRLQGRFFFGAQFAEYVDGRLLAIGGSDA